MNTPIRLRDIKTRNKLEIPQNPVVMGRVGRLNEKT